ncbi:hypothetical protein C0J52_01006 [Blattella germanica]|nr:hypothetical protein C0J52_01006 [Blattella germanica]
MFARWINLMDWMYLTNQKCTHNIYVKNAGIWDTIAEESKLKISLYVDKVLPKQQKKETQIIQVGKEHRLADCCQEVDLILSSKIQSGECHNSLRTIICISLLFVAKHILHEEIIEIAQGG